MSMQQFTQPIVSATNGGSGAGGASTPMLTPAQVQTPVVIAAALPVPTQTVSQQQNVVPAFPQAPQPTQTRQQTAGGSNNTNRRKAQQQMYHQDIGEISHSDLIKIYDKTIMKGCDYQAYIPRLSDPFNDTFTFKIYGYSYQKSSVQQMYTKNEEENVIINVPRRNTQEYIEWDPVHFSHEFKVLCFRLGQYIKQNYNLDFSDYEILEYYRICRMNKGIFLNTIHSDHSPFLEFVRAKRNKALK